MSRRVAVTGLGLATGLGLDLESSWEGLIAGRSVTKRFTVFDPEGLACPFGVELPADAEAFFRSHFKTRQRRQMTRGTLLAGSTARAAIADAALLDEGVERARIGVVVGATGTGYAPLDARKIDEHRILRNMASASAAWIALREGLKGPSFVVSTACSSGAYALSAAYGLLVSGQCDAVVSGAGDSALSFLDIQGFCSLMALAEEAEDPATASRPFDARRCGFVMGEGAGMLVLETLEHAEERGARVYAELSQPGLCTEAYNIISPEPGGVSMARAMELALAHAGVEPGDVGYVNAHGTSTRLNDLYETRAIERVFGEAAESLAVSSTKSMTGHCLSAAAGVEAVISVLALDRGVLPPTINHTEPDPELGLDYVPNESRAEAGLAHVMSSSFAFGGQNGVCIFSKPGAR